MSHEFEECLKQNRIREFTRGKFLVQKELKTAEEDFNEARESYKRSGYKWTTIQTYYSMFHSARALLYYKNYRERSHYCLITALKFLYGQAGKLPVYLIEGLQKAKNLREDADYYGEWSKIAAEEMIALTAEFLNKAKEIIKQLDAPNYGEMSNQDA